MIEQVNQSDELRDEVEKELRQRENLFKNPEQESTPTVEPGPLPELPALETEEPEVTSNRTFEIKLNDLPLDCSLVFRNLPDHIDAATFKLMTDITKKIMKFNTLTGRTVNSIKATTLPLDTSPSKKETMITLSEKILQHYASLTKGKPLKERMEIGKALGIVANNQASFEMKEWYMKKKAKDKHWQVDW